MYDSEESEDEVSTINVLSINEDTRSGKMWTEVKGDNPVFEFRGKDQVFNLRKVKNSRRTNRHNNF